MSSNKNIAGKNISFKKMYMAIVFVLLVGLAGKVYLFSLSVSADVQKSLLGYVNNNSAQEDTTDTEEGKFSNKLLTGDFAPMNLILIPESQNIGKTPFCQYITQFTAPHFLTVPTPPPNC